MLQIKDVPVDKPVEVKRHATPILKDKYKGLFTKYDADRKLQHYIRAIKKCKFDRPVQYKDIQTTRLNEFKDDTIARIDQIRLS